MFLKSNASFDNMCNHNLFCLLCLWFFFWGGGGGGGGGGHNSWHIWIFENFSEELFIIIIQSNLVDKDTEGAIESVRFKGVFIWSGWIWRKCKSFPSPGTKQTVRNNEVSMLSGRVSVKWGLTVFSNSSHLNLFFIFINKMRIKRMTTKGKMLLSFSNIFSKLIKNENV